jgi:hypothetical protein
MWKSRVLHYGMMRTTAEGYIPIPNINVDVDDDGGTSFPMDDDGVVKKIELRNNKTLVTTTTTTMMMMMIMTLLFALSSSSLFGGNHTINNEVAAPPNVSMFIDDSDIPPLPQPLNSSNSTDISTIIFSASSASSRSFKRVCEVSWSYKQDQDYCSKDNSISGRFLGTYCWSRFDAWPIGNWGSGGKRDDNWCGLLCLH